MLVYIIHSQNLLNFLITHVRNLQYVFTAFALAVFRNCATGTWGMYTNTVLFLSNLKTPKLKSSPIFVCKVVMFIVYYTLVSSLLDPSTLPAFFLTFHPTVYVIAQYLVLVDSLLMSDIYIYIYFFFEVSERSLGPAVNIESLIQPVAP